MISRTEFIEWFMIYSEIKVGELYQHEYTNHSFSSFPWGVMMFMELN